MRLKLPTAQRDSAAVFRVVIGVFVALAPLAPSAARGQDTPRLRLQDVFQETARRNPQVAAARALARAADARIPSTRRPPDPQLQLGFMNYTLPGLAPMGTLGMQVLQVMQMVPVGGKLGLATRVAVSQASAQAERTRDVEWTLRSDAAMAFYDLYENDQALRVAREALRLVQDIRRIADVMYRAGEGRQADVLRAQVDIARMVADTLRMTSMRIGMAARLNALRDRPVDAAVAAPALPLFPDEVPPLESLVALAEAGRPMVQWAEREAEAADAQAMLARRDIWPDLTVGLQYGKAASAMSSERMGSLMLGVTVPVFARSRQFRMRDETAAMRQMALADLQAMRADTRGRITTAHADLLRARALTSLYRTTVIPLSEAALASAINAYRAGSVDFMTLLDNRMTVNKYRQELFTLQADEGRAWTDLEMLLGRALVDAGTVAIEDAMPSTTSAR